MLQTAFNRTNGIGPLGSGYASDRWDRTRTRVFTYLGGLYAIAAILIWFVRPRR
jgi:MFS family permease